MTGKHLIESPIILGTAQGQHLITVGFIPPGPRALEPHMTNELIRRFDAPTAQWIASATKLAIGGAPPMGMKVFPTVGKCLAASSAVDCIRLSPPSTALTLPK